MEYAYFPGCSLESTAKEYDMSTREICNALGIELQEIKDWNCCGATSVTSVSKVNASALPARNMAFAEKKGQDIVTPCNACFNKLKKAHSKLEENPELKEKISKVLKSEEGIEYTGGLKIHHILDVIATVPIDKLKNKIVKSLKDLKVVPYYGCLIVKAPQFMDSENPDRPMFMDNLVEAIGAKAVEFDLKTRCCGGPVTFTQEAVQLKLTGDILKRAKEMEADCLVVPCPMCHYSLDAKQEDVEKFIGEKINMPILYITQLIGLALGIETKKLGLKKNIVDAKRVLEAVV